MSHHNDTGKKGEELAAVYLRQQGFTILHCNWRHSHYEIDIIAHRNDLLHFIEVKTRRSLTYGQPEESISKKKLECLLKGGAAYQEQFPQWRKVQYDVLSITLLKGQEPEYFFIEDVYL
ncbi:MAG: YraN family protein [Chitinophagaceae bacterium]